MTWQEGKQNKPFYKRLCFILIVVMGVILVTTGCSNEVDISEVESINKPTDVSNIEVETEGNVNKITIIFSHKDVESAKEYAEKIFKELKKKDGDNYMMQLLDKDGKSLGLGQALMGEKSIYWN